jgi:hemolysin activation/secretion protein
MLNKNLFTVALLALSPSVFAQQLPDAGSQSQQIPPAPTPQRFEPNISVEPQSIPATTETDATKIMVNRLSVTGSQAYSEAELIAVTGFTPGSELSLTELRSMASKIGNYYRRNGYFVAQAYLPAQEIKDGNVSIAVIEGKYDKITLDNQTRLNADLANSHLDGLNSGEPITAAPLENRLLLLSDIPGVKVKSTLIPGASLGTSDLNVELTPGPLVSGEVDFDNAGNRYTGEYRLGATINLNNPTGNGDLASLRGMTSGTGLDYARASYQMQFGKARAGVAYSRLNYRLGKEFESLGAHGTAEIASIFGSYPLIRTRDGNLSAGLAYEDKTFQDKVDTTSAVTDKKAQVLLASLQGSQRDGFAGGGMTGYTLTLSAGNIDIQTPAARAADAATAKSNGHFNKLGVNLFRLQRVTDSVSISAALNSQVASKNLDSSEKMELGGMYGVRAYPEGEAYADQGYVLNLEARYLLPKPADSYPGQMHLIGFIDTGSVAIHKNPWAAGSNKRTLSGAGIGLTWIDVNNFSIKTYYAVKLGNEAAISAPDKSGRFWIQLVKYF